MRTAREILNALLEDDAIMVKPGDRNRFMVDWAEAMDALSALEEEAARPKLHQWQADKITLWNAFGKSDYQCSAGRTVAVGYICPHCESVNPSEDCLKMRPGTPK